MNQPTDGWNAALAFHLVWNALVGVLGTGATATLFRRAVRNGTAHRPDLPELKSLEIARKELEYRYVLPSSWSGRDERSLETLKYLIQEELYPLLEELTGPVVIRLLERQPELQGRGFLPSREASHG